MVSHFLPKPTTTNDQLLANANNRFISMEVGEYLDDQPSKWIVTMLSDYPTWVIPYMTIQVASLLGMITTYDPQE